LTGHDSDVHELTLALAISLFNQSINQ